MPVDRTKQAKRGDRKKKVVAAAVVAAAVAHHAAAKRVVDKQAVAGLRGQYDAGLSDLSRSLASQFKGRRRELVTPATAREITKYTNMGIALALGAVAGGLAAQTADITRESVHRLSRFLGAVRAGQPSALDEPRIAERVAMARAKELKRLRISAMGDMGGDAAAVVKAKLAELPLAEGTVNDAIAEALELADGEWWRVERVARTETSRAFNATMDEGISELAEELPGLTSRWTEYVDDLTGEPLDDRVGDDSLVLHGQLRGEDGLFIMPADELAPTAMIGQTWDAPPNRPNCRAVLLPWMKEWGIPAWVYKDGERVDVELP